MADGRINNKGKKGNKGGNPGYGKLEFLRKKVNQHSESWWINWEDMMNGHSDWEGKKLAMVEFNKLQLKMIPLDMDITTDGKPIFLPTTLLDKNNYVDSSQDPGVSSTVQEEV